MVDRRLTAAAAEEWIKDHDRDSDEGLGQMITWLHEYRPRPDEDLPFEDQD